MTDASGRQTIRAFSGILVSSSSRSLRPFVHLFYSHVFHGLRKSNRRSRLVVRVNRSEEESSRARVLPVTGILCRVVKMGLTSCVCCFMRR